MDVVSTLGTVGSVLALTGTAGTLLYNRSQRKKTPQINTGLDADSLASLTPIIDALVQPDIRRKKEKEKFARQCIEDALELTAKYADMVFPNGDEQKRRDYIDAMFPIFLEQLLSLTTRKKPVAGFLEKMKHPRKNGGK